MSEVVIEYPLVEAIQCEFCRRNAARGAEDDQKRRRGLFKAASRRQNYVRHLQKFHDVAVERIKVRCSLCGRISEKPLSTAWRDIQTHHRREHAPPPRQLQAEEPGPPSPVRLEPQRRQQQADLGDASLALPAQQEGVHQVQVVAEQEAIDFSLPKQEFPANYALAKRLFPAAPNTRYDSPFDFKGEPASDSDMSTNILYAAEEPEGSCSPIIRAMGQFFNVVVGNVADFHAPAHHLTPTKKLPKQQQQQQTVALNLFYPDDTPRYSKIVPLAKARPPIRRTLKRLWDNPSPPSFQRKKFRSCRDPM